MSVDEKAPTTNPSGTTDATTEGTGQKPAEPEPTVRLRVRSKQRPLVQFGRRRLPVPDAMGVVELPKSVAAELLVYHSDVYVEPKPLGFGSAPSAADEETEAGAPSEASHAGDVVELETGDVTASTGEEDDDATQS
jgi:hypothetical protein